MINKNMLRLPLASLETNTACKLLKSPPNNSKSFKLAMVNTTSSQMSQKD